MFQRNKHRFSQLKSPKFSDVRSFKVPSFGRGAEMSKGSEELKPSFTDPAIEGQPVAMKNLSMTGDSAPIQYISKSDWLSRQRSPAVREHFLQTPSSSYTGTQELRLFVGTWNVAGRTPARDLNLKDWLDPQEDADILVVGFQEIVPLNGANTLFGTETNSVDVWERCVDAALNDARKPPECTALADDLLGLDTQWTTGAHTTQEATKGSTHGEYPPAEQPTGSGWSEFDCDRPQQEYVRLGGKQLVGIYMSVWVKRKLAGAVRGIDWCTVACGFGGYLGNKGAVAMRMQVYESPVCFICAHLQSGEAPGASFPPAPPTSAGRSAPPLESPA
ncbi:hypothetical protein CYMTET_22671 [Cymbomonas tetramitiformis]|uniref:Inositol polyphosphate-related phosphatase domain-containing protein n=1 Tax=Cymbomonas tetramitiformis TaxID=36881 RepID=A0AAE0L1Q6_9CHLO|nr:hypothetical protein CYMTET_22671 [Cymbomonas tetramitiformis]